MKTIIDKRILKYAKQRYNIEFRFGPKPSAVDIMGVDHLADKPAAYVGEGVIWMKDTYNGRKYSYYDLQLIAGHEVGHAITGMLPELAKMPLMVHEHHANAVGIFICAHFGIPVSKRMLMKLAKFAHQKKV